MLRSILGVVAGYLALVFFMFVVFTLLYLALGVDGAYKPGSYEVSGLWLGLSIIVGFAAATVGGVVAVLASGKQQAAIGLVGAVLVLGALGAMGVAQQNREGPPPAREADVSIADAMQNSRQPLWVAILNPFIGAVGVMTGAQLVARRQRPTPHD
ncbi:MAG: hypothetical protein EA379_10810 [Phycisphaerales bacterium]|nr:MAG: hypothetical protein EA379_10810 [Phycisphaerales bacterium]